VTLDELAAMVKRGKKFLVYEAKTGADITRSVLAQIVFDQENSTAHDSTRTRPEQMEEHSRTRAQNRTFDWSLATAFVIGRLRRNEESTIVGTVARVVHPNPLPDPGGGIVISHAVFAFGMQRRIGVAFLTPGSSPDPFSVGCFWAASQP